MKPNLQPIRGFRDLYPEDKAVQNYIFEKIKETARIFGFEQYDGPIVEPIDIYVGKTSRELIDRQTFQIKDKNGQILILRPEMTPSLARMIAQKERELTLPIRLCNVGARFRYEAPQKGREREFYQADFDLLGASGVLSDAEMLSVAVSIFSSFGATEKDFVIYINSRENMRKKLQELGVGETFIKDVINVIDRKEKVPRNVFTKLLSQIGISEGSVKKINDFLENPTDYETCFNELLDVCKSYGIDQYVRINPSIVRGLDYYTGLVFEVKEKGGEMSRSLLGGGRYDNLIENFGASRKISGIGFATSDVIIWEFLKTKKLLPSLRATPTNVLVTVFDPSFQSLQSAIEITRNLRSGGISTEIFPDASKKLDKQLKYADRKKIPLVVIIGPDEVKNNTAVLKDLKKNTQETVSQEKLI